MTVLELKQYLERLCYEGKHQHMVRFAIEPFTSEHMYITPFSERTDEDGIGFVTLTDRDGKVANINDPRKVA